MKYLFLSVAFLQCIATASAKQNKPEKQPKLVVGIVIDQMRWDYLYRFQSRYSDGGFKRIMNEGFNCQNTMINYVPTFTAPGHTCVYTGSVPAIHGIVANDWIDNATEKPVYCTEDNTVHTIGSDSKAGLNSPANLLATTVADELKLAKNMQAKVFGLAIKDRGAILPAGHTANGAYWFDDVSGNFVTSSYYTKELPEWMTGFNNKRWADTFIGRAWDTKYPIGSYKLSLADDNPYEGKLKGEKAPVFPHIAKQDGKGYGALRYLPGGNTIVLKAAKACINAEGLGKDDITDMLCISLSTPDYVGHMFTPNSVEAEDMYLRLDAELASFFNYLDRKIGEGNYTLFITADHGAAHNSNYLKSINIPAGNKAESAALKGVNAYVKERVGKDSMVLDLSNYQVYLNEKRIASLKQDREDVKEAVAEWFKKQDGVAYVVDMEDMDDAVIPATIKEMIVNGYNRKRSGCIQVILEPGFYSGYGPTGTTHGTWNPYDAHIPLLWYGAGIKNGETHRTVHMTDIAATLSALLHIQMPNGCVGTVIQEVIE